MWMKYGGHWGHRERKEKDCRGNGLTEGGRGSGDEVREHGEQEMQIKKEGWKRKAKEKRVCGRNEEDMD